MKKAYGLGDSYLIEANPLLSQKFLKNQIVYSHLNCSQDSQDLNFHSDCNVGESTRLLHYLEMMIEQGVKYDLLIIHVGLHDIKCVQDNQECNVSKDRFVANLHKILEKVFFIANHVYWLAMPPVYDLLHQRQNVGFLRHSQDVLLYNELSKKTLESQGVFYIDEYAFLENEGMSSIRDHVHLTEKINDKYTSWLVSEIVKIEND